MDKGTFFKDLFQDGSDDQAHKAARRSALPAEAVLPRVKRPKSSHALHDPSDKDDSSAPPFYCMDNSLISGISNSTSRSPSLRSSFPPPIAESSERKTARREKRSEDGEAAKKGKEELAGKTPLPWLGCKGPIGKGSKRSKKAKAQAIPEEKQIFRGLRFYYYPNSDVNPARRFQMKKAAERGAERIETFGLSATHIIVDSRYSFHQLLAHLQLPSIPPDIHVVSDNYAGECIELGYILDPLQSRFHVKGGIPRGFQPEQRSIATSSLQLTSKTAESEETPGYNHGLDTPMTDRSYTFDEAIVAARRGSGLPIDESSDLELEYPAVEATTTRNKVQSRPSWQDRFQCMHAHSGLQVDTNANARTISILQQMQGYYERTNDSWRAMSYQRAATALKRHAKKVETREEALAIPGIGESLANKIEEIAHTDSLRRLEHVQADPDDQALELFTGVYGAGPKQAQAWIARGFRTLDDLRSHAELTPTQRVGIDRYHDFAARIPRDEIEKHGIFVRDTLAALEPRAEVQIGGSYRRGASNSGDIDFLIFGPDDISLGTLQALVFEQLIPALFRKGYLQYTLAACPPILYANAPGEPDHSPRCKLSSREKQEPGSFSKWLGAAALPHPGQGPASWRCVDFLVVPAAERGAALLYFTGSALFNRSMRLLARKRGMKLNQRGLWARPRAGSRTTNEEFDSEKLVAGALLEAREERKIFEILGVPWREAHERDC